MYTDFEGFPDSLYNESLSSSELDQIIEFSNLDEDEREKVNAFIDCFGGDFTQALEKYEDAYQGEFKSDEDFAEEMAEQCGFEAPSAWPYNCIDWERAARDLMYDYSESNGHYFSSNW